MKKKLSPLAEHVLLEKGTEAPFTSELLKEKGDGMYHCGGCGAALFASDAKFDSGTGWPSFDAAAGKVKLVPDTSHGMRRTEVVCAQCGGHLGHVFADGPTKTGERYCINGCALSFSSKK